MTISYKFNEKDTLHLIHTLLRLVGEVLGMDIHVFAYCLLSLYAST